MCRFTFYMGRPIFLSSLVTEPSHSIIRQSFESNERDEPLNGDGFGVAWYARGVDERPAVFRSVTPAWSNRNLIDLARVVSSPCILTHVRAATQALQVSESNCHPFRHGRYAFMHNGDIGGFRKIRRRLLASLPQERFDGIEGSTDSEHLFAVILDELLETDDLDPIDAMSAAVRSAMRRVLTLVEEEAPGELCYVNLVLTDGMGAVACRFTTDLPEHADSLYLNHGMRYICHDGVCQMVNPEGGEGAVIISSEPLSDGPGWTAVPPNHLVRVHIDNTVEIQPFDERLEAVV